MKEEEQGIPQWRLDKLALIQPENQIETIALARTLTPESVTLSDATMIVLVGMVESGGDAEAVAMVSGIELGRLKQHYQTATASKVMRALARHRLSSEGFATAIDSLINTARTSSSAPARNTASKLIHDIIGDLDEKEGKADGRSLDELSAEELESQAKAILARLSAPKSHKS